MESSRLKYESLLSAFDKDLNVVIANRKELAGVNEEPEAEESEDELDSSDYDENLND